MTDAGHRQADWQRWRVALTSRSLWHRGSFVTTGGQLLTEQLRHNGAERQQDPRPPESVFVGSRVSI
jgi:REP element-mobilizing transposase RayT